MCTSKQSLVSQARLTDQQSKKRICRRDILRRNPALCLAEKCSRIQESIIQNPGEGRQSRNGGQTLFLRYRCCGFLGLSFEFWILHSGFLVSTACFRLSLQFTNVGNQVLNFVSREFVFIRLHLFFPFVENSFGNGLGHFVVFHFRLHGGIGIIL